MLSAQGKVYLDRVKEVLYRATLLPQSARSGFLERECAGDTDLFSEVESLLRFERGAAEVQRGQWESFLRPADCEPTRYPFGAVIAGRYRVDRLLGRGGMGEVYAVHDQLLELPVALKTLRVLDAARRRWLIEEVRLARRVTHPAVCRVHDIGEDDGSPFLTMELIDGEDVATRLARGQSFSSHQVARIGATIASGLAAAHAAGVLHRDLKPANIVIGIGGDVRVMDFGISSPSGAGPGRGSDATGAARFGTPSYMAPEEIAFGAAPSAQSDLYSLGVVLYEMLTGGLPFDAVDTDVLIDQHRLGWVEAPSRRAVEVDPELETLVLRLLAMEARARPVAAAQVAFELEAITRRPWLRASLRARVSHLPS